MILTWLGYAVAVSCIVTYIYAAAGHSLTPNLWANAIGGPIVAIGNSLVGYWPAVVLEVFFTFAGIYGLCRLWRQRRRRVYDWRLAEMIVPYNQDLWDDEHMTTPHWIPGEPYANVRRLHRD